MKYRRMGDTGLSLSEIGFGCGGNAGLMTKGSYKEQIDAVARAAELNAFLEKVPYARYQRRHGR